jgi:hypothetical protein
MGRACPLDIWQRFNATAAPFRRKLVLVGLLTYEQNHADAKPRIRHFIERTAEQWSYGGFIGRGRGCLDVFAILIFKGMKITAVEDWM